MTFMATPHTGSPSTASASAAASYMPMTMAASPAPEPGRRFDSTLAMNEIIGVGDYIVSGNGLFFAILQADGNFCVYRGIDVAHDHGLLWGIRKSAEGGEFFALVQTDGNFCIYRGTDLMHNRGWHWGTQVTAEGNAFYAAMQDDGNFCIRKGSGANDSHGLVWASGVTDRVENIDEILHIEYDLDAARVMRTSPASLYSETLHNRGPGLEHRTVASAVTVTETSSWSDTLAIRQGSHTAFMPGIPVVDGDDVVLAETPTTYIWNGASATTKNWSFSTPVTVAPSQSVRAVVSATYSTISVPYTLIGRLRFESGAQVVGTVKGVYMGSNAHDLTAHFTPLDAKPINAQRISRKLTPILEKPYRLF
jgi:hypothetical protein